MADYPSSIWVPPVRGTNLSDAVTQTDILDEQNAEIVATQTELGTTPSGSFATVTARLAASIRWRGSDTVHSGTGSAFTTVTPDTEIEDTSTIWTSGSNFVIPETSPYIFSMGATPASGNCADDILRLTINGTTYHSGKGAAVANFYFVWAVVASASSNVSFAIFNASATRNYAIGITIAKLGVPA